MVSAGLEYPGLCLAWLGGFFSARLGWAWVQFPVFRVGTVGKAEWVVVGADS